MSDKLPHNSDLEQQVLGQCILDNKIVDPTLEASDFYGFRNQTVWTAIVELDEEGKELDPVQIQKVVKRNNPAVSVSLKEITDLATGLIPHSSLSTQLKQLKELGVRRRTIKELNNTIGRLGDEGSNYREVIDNQVLALNNTLGAVVGRDQGFQSMDSIIESNVIPALSNLRDGKIQKISTGFEKLDRFMGGGLTGSDVFLVAGLPGGGKSALVLQIAKQIAEQKVGVAYVSGEMQNEENGLRLLSTAAGVFNLNSITHLGVEDHDFLVEWAKHLKSLPIFFDHASTDLQTMRSKFRALLLKHDIKVLCIDYIQLFRIARNDVRGRVERIAEVSQEIKRIAIEFNVAVIEVAQFNRVGAKSERPSMHDLEGSGQLEKDPSYIALIDFLEKYHAGTPNEYTSVEIRFVKGRNTGQGSITGKFYGPHLKFDLD